MTTIESEWSDSSSLDDPSNTFSKQQKPAFQIHNSFIVSQIKSGYMLIDQQSAHERILYERYLAVLSEKENYTQKQLFPKTIEVSAVEAALMQDILPQINQLGFDIQDFGNNSFVVHGVPADLSGKKNEQQMIEQLLEQYKANLELKLDLNENLARSMARSSSIKRGQVLTATEMQELIDQLFACKVPYKNPTGRHCFLTFELEELEKRFNIS